MTDIIFEQTIKHTTKPISLHTQPTRTHIFGLYILVQAFKSSNKDRVRRAVEKYSEYSILMKLKIYNQDGTEHFMYWPMQFLSMVPRIDCCISTYVDEIRLHTKKILSKEVLDYLSSIQLKDEDFCNPTYLYNFKQTLQTKLDLSPHSTCVEDENSLCEEFELLHKKNKELQDVLSFLKIKIYEFTGPKNVIELQKENTELHQSIKLLQQNHTELYQMVKLLQKDRESDQLKLQKIQIDNTELRQLVKLLQKDKEFEQLPILKLGEKIRCLEIENAGQSRQMRKTENDITKLTKQLTDSLKESSGLSFTHANTIGQALMKEDIFNCM